MAVELALRTPAAQSEDLRPLLYLIDHRKRVVRKEELLQALWPEQFIEKSTLTQHIFLLRKTLSRHDSQPLAALTPASYDSRRSAARSPTSSSTSPCSSSLSSSPQTAYVRADTGPQWL